MSGQPKRVARREEVLDLAVGYLADNGLSNFTMRRLATALDVSTNTISYQFGSKEGLIEAALERARTMTLNALIEIRDEHPGIDAYRAARELWDWWMEDRRNLFATRLNMEAMVASDDDVPKDRRPGLMTYWIDYFADWIQEESGCDREFAVIRATQLMALLSGVVTDLQSTQDRDRLRAALDDYIHIVGSG